VIRVAANQPLGESYMSTLYSEITFHELMAMKTSDKRIRDIVLATKNAWRPTLFVMTVTLKIGVQSKCPNKSTCHFKSRLCILLNRKN
jgi:hypothetical protein